MSLKAAIFDLDGTVISDEIQFGIAFKKILSKYKIIEKSSYPHLGGIGVRENWEMFVKKYSLKLSESLDEITQETINEYFRLLDQVKVKPGFFELVNELRRKNIKTALATSSTKQIVIEVFKHLPIKDFFDVVTYGDDVLHKKPDPSIFILTAERLGVLCNECIVFEDSEAGINSAINAKMKVIGIYRDEIHRNELIGASLFINDYTQIKRFRGDKRFMCPSIFIQN